MAGSKFISGLLTVMIAAFFAGGPVYAHGGDVENGDPGYGMAYPMESDSMEEYCTGCGAMGGHGMDHGMMGGRGQGNGEMDSFMYGLDLSSEQRKQIARIDSELRKHNWVLQGEVLDAQEKLFDLYEAETPDAEKIGAVYGKIFDLKRQMIEATIKAQNRQRAILTEEQREQFRKSPYRSRNGGYWPGSGSMGHHHGHHMMGG